MWYYYVSAKFIGCRDHDTVAIAVDTKRHYKVGLRA